MRQILTPSNANRQVIPAMPLTDSVFVNYQPNPQAQSGNDGLDDFDTFLRCQMLRVTSPTSQNVHVERVSAHASGKRKPNLSQQELEGLPWRKMRNL